VWTTLYMIVPKASSSKSNCPRAHEVNLSEHHTTSHRLLAMPPRCARLWRTKALRKATSQISDIEFLLTTPRYGVVIPEDQEAAVRGGVLMVSFPKKAGPCLGWIAAIVVLAFMDSGTLRAQSITGRILGSVHDQQDSAISGARVTVTDILRNISHTTVTDDTGDYVVPDLPPSTYKVSVEAQGFNGFQAPGISVEVGKDVRVDATLKTGDSKIVVTITEDIPLLDSTTSSLGGTLSNKEINDLPLNGRNYE